MLFFFVSNSKLKCYWILGEIGIKLNLFRKSNLVVFYHCLYPWSTRSTSLFLFAFFCCLSVHINQRFLHQGLGCTHFSTFNPLILLIWRSHQKKKLKKSKKEKIPRQICPAHKAAC